MSQALIFDLDGTLVESLPGIASSLNRALKLHGLLGHSHEAVRRFIGDGSRMLVTRALGSDSVALHLESVLSCFASDYAVSWQDGTIPYEGIRELLMNLSDRGIPLAVLSNKPHSFTTEICAALFPEISFHCVLGNREGLPHKPDPAGALEISSQLGLDTANCTIIGDSTMDLDTAHNAGMKSIAVTWGYHDRARLHYADVIAENVAELSDFLLAHG